MQVKPAEGVGAERKPSPDSAEFIGLIVKVVSVGSRNKRLSAPGN